MAKRYPSVRVLRKCGEYRPHQGLSIRQIVLPDPGDSSRRKKLLVGELEGAGTELASRTGFWHRGRGQSGLVDATCCHCAGKSSLSA
jgi:hypothetical protein